AVRAHVAEQLRAGRTRLDVGEIEDADALKRLARLPPQLGRWRRQVEPPVVGLCHYCPPVEVSVSYFLRSALCGLTLQMRALSLPAAGSITALMRVGLPLSMAWLTARFSSSGVVAFTPTPPNASIILS